MTGISGAVQIAIAAALLGGYLLLLGAAVRIVVARWWAPAWPLGLTMAVGAAASSVVVAASYRLLGAASLPVMPLGALAAIVIATSVARRLRDRRRTGLRPAADGSPLGAWVQRTDWAAAGLAAFVLLPLLRYGPTFWTSWVNDFIAYASSVQVWTGTSGAPGVDFASAHPDWFGPAHEARANHEKPMMTGLLVAAAGVTRLPAYQLLVPTMLVLLFVLASTTMRLVRVRFDLPDGAAVTATALPFLSVVPLARVYDAQLGQVSSVALLAGALLLLVIEPPSSRGGLIGAGFVVGLVAAAAVGSNATLVLGSAIALSGLWWWLISSPPSQRGMRARTTAVAGVVAVALCLPFLSWFLTSLADQTSGTQGYDVPLPAPWAVLGQQLSLTSTPGTFVTLMMWCVLAVIGLAVLIMSSRATGWRSRHTSVVIVAGAVAVNVTLVAIRTGWTNYSVHKLTAVLILLVGPCLLGLLASALPPRSRPWANGVMVALCVSACVIAWRAAGTVVYVMPPELLALGDDQGLREVPALDIMLDGHGEASFAALVVPSRTTYVTLPPFTPSEADFEGSYLMRSLDVPSDPGWIASSRNAVYTVVRFEQTVTGPSTAFTAGAPESRRHLFGQWYPAEDWGTWSASERSTVVIRARAELRSGAVDLVVMGAPYAEPTHARTVSYVVNGVTLATEMFRSSEQRPVTLQVPATVVRASDGRLKLELVNSDPIQPASIGGADQRVLAFALSTIEMRAASAR